LKVLLVNGTSLVLQVSVTWFWKPGSWLAVYSGSLVPGTLPVVPVAQLPPIDSMNSFQVRVPPVPSMAWKMFGTGAVVSPLVMAS